MILVVGATGSLGRKVTRLLLADGHRVRAMTRIVAKADELKALGAQPIRGDLRDPESLEFGLRGATAVIAAAHSILGRGDESSKAVDDEGHRALIDAAREAGVQHFIYTSAIGASPDHPVDFWRTKAGVEAYLKKSGLTYTILRPTAFMELYCYELIGKAVVTGKRVVLLGPGRNPRNYVAVEDVAKVALGALKMPSLKNEIIEIGGPENLTLHEIVAIFERAAKTKAKVAHVPLPVLRTMSIIAARAHPGIARIMRAAILAETTEQAFNPAQLKVRFPIALTSLDEWVRQRVNPATERVN